MGSKTRICLHSPCDDVIPSQVPFDRGFDGGEECITTIAAECVVDLSEAINIDHQYADWIAFLQPIVCHHETPHVGASRS